MYSGQMAAFATNAKAGEPKLPTITQAYWMKHGLLRRVVFLVGGQRNARLGGRASALFSYLHPGRALEPGSVVISVAITIAVVPHMIHGSAIAFLEAFAEFATVVLIDRRVLVYLMIISISVTAIHIVAAGCFHTFTEALALRVTIPIW